MINRVTSLLIGKDISRDAQVVAGEQLDVIMKSTGLAAGEVVVLDKNRTVLASGATVVDSDSIYIVQATSDTFDYTNKAGTAVTGNRRIKMVGPIFGSQVKTYLGKAYSAKAEKTATLTLTGMTPVAGTEYIVRIVYKDVVEHPGQYTQTYRYIATAADAASVDVFGAAIAAKINAHSGRRVNATYTTGTDALLLTAKEIPQGTSTLTEIDSFKQVNFYVFFNYVDSDGFWQTWPTTSDTIIYTGPTRGEGEWEHIRDLENDVRGYRGISNLTHFPVIVPDHETVLNETYDQIVIEFQSPYKSPDNGYEKNAPQTVVIALADGASQTTDILAQLNPWMASAGFDGVSF